MHFGREPASAKRSIALLSGHLGRYPHTTNRQVAAMFTEEKPALLPLPLEPFRYYQFGDGEVHPDGCVEVEAAYFSAPPDWIGGSVKVQWDSTLGVGAR